MGEKQKGATAAGMGNRAAIACRSCRQRKVKCDVQAVPSEGGCGPCRRAGKECQLDPMSDGRRTVNRKCVAKLQERIEMLEARTRDSIRWFPSDDGLSSDHTSVDYTPVVLPSGPSASLHDTAPLPPAPAHKAPLSADGSSPGWCTSSYGSPSFYGATCHPHVVASVEDPQQFVQDGDATGGLGMGMGIDLDPTSPHLRAHLFQSFFKYQTLWVDVVDKASFLRHQQAGGHGPSRWWSRFLENTMLACGSRLSTSKSVRALGPKYCEWAKDDVLRAMSDPSPANLQGFLLLSEYEVTQGNDRPAWMHCGVACRMLADLGLHELALADAPPVDAAAAAHESSRESDLAYALLSACVVFEGVWTLYLGRPSSIPPSVMAVVAKRCRQRRKADTPWLNAWVGLCGPMAEITRMLNDKAAADADRRASLRTLAAQVDAWYQALPPELAYDQDRLINMHLAGYGVHSQYCKIQILLQRALAPKPNPRKRPHAQMAAGDGADGGVGADGGADGGNGSGGGGSDGDGDGSDGTRAPRERGDAAAYPYALRVARLVVTYREAFGMEHIPSIMLDNAVVAATAMIRHFNSRDGAADMADDAWLHQLLICMDSMTAHFPVIGRMLESLKPLCASDRLQNMLPPARRGSTEAPAREPHRGLSVADGNDRASNSSGRSSIHGRGSVDARGMGSESGHGGGHGSGSGSGSGNGHGQGSSGGNCHDNGGANDNGNGVFGNSADENSIVVSVAGSDRQDAGRAGHGVDGGPGHMGAAEHHGPDDGRHDSSGNHDTPMDDQELLWDCFDAGMVPGMGGVFPSTAFGDFVLDMPPATVLGSALS